MPIILDNMQLGLCKQDLNANDEIEIWMKRQNDRDEKDIETEIDTQKQRHFKQTKDKNIRDL